MKEGTAFRFSFGYLLKLMGKYKAGIWLIITLNVLWSVFQICIPFLTKALVDSGIQNTDLNIIIAILVAQFLLFIGISISDIYRKWLLRHIGVRVNLQLVINFLKGIIRKPFSFFNVQEQGKTIQHFNDNLRIESFLTNHSSDFFNACIKLIIYALLLFIFSLKLGLVFVAFNLGLIIWISFFLKTREHVDNHRFKVNARARTELIEMFSGIIDLKAYNQEENRLNSWDRVQSHFSDVRLNMLRINQIIYAGINSLAQMRDIIIIFIAAVATMNGEMTLGTLLAIQYILGQLNEPVDKLIDFVPQYQDARLSLKRINEAVSTQDLESNQVTSTLVPEKSTITLEEVTYGYVPTKNAVENVSMDIPFGRSIAILGESGSGKSTLMKLMLKFMRVDAGSIKIGTKNLDLIRAKDWLERTNVVLQESMLFNRSVLYNITFQEEEDKVDIERVFECLKLCEISDVVYNLEDGLHSIVGSDGINFSKGQAQRIILARAMYQESDYYFLDEPFSALDNITYRKVFKNIRETLVNKTLIIVTHRMEVAKKMDMIYLLEEGKLIETGSHDELSQLGRRYTKIFLSDDED